MFNTRGTQKTPVFIKNCIFSYAFKLQSPSKHSFDAIYLLRHFFHCSKQFLNLLILMPFSTSAVFYFTSSTPTKCFPLRTFFIQGNKKKCHSCEIGWIGRVGHGDHAGFGQKLLNTQFVEGRCTSKSLIMKWANTLKESSKNSLKPNASSHNNTS